MLSRAKLTNFLDKQISAIESKIKKLKQDLVEEYEAEDEDDTDYEFDEKYIQLKSALVTYTSLRTKISNGMFEE